MSAAAPWSVKGIDPKAREIAKDLARREGMTLGEWLNSRIMVENDGDQDDVTRDRRASGRQNNGSMSPEDAARRLNAIVTELGERLEAAERRSASAIQNVDEAVSGIVRRMESDREDTASNTRRLDDMAREMREGHQRLQKLESASGEAAVADLRERLDRAQEATGLALKGLERSFAALDNRMGGGGEAQERLSGLATSLTQQIEANRLDLMRKIESVADAGRLSRIEQAVAQLSAQTKAAEMRSARAVEAMGHEIMRIARNMNGRMQALEETASSLGSQNLSDQEIDTRIDARLALSLDSRIDHRLAELGRTLDEKLDREIARQSASLDARLTRQEDDHALALERLGGEITRISDRLSERITQTERRSAQAIDDIGRRLSESTERFERHHEDASSELAERLRQSEERTRRLVEEAREVRAQREAAAFNSAPRLTAALPPTDELTFEPMPEASSNSAASLFAEVEAMNGAEPAKPASDWHTSMFAQMHTEAVPAPVAEAQASAGWADEVAADMAVEPFPTVESMRPFGNYEDDTAEAMEEDFGLASGASDERALSEEGDFASLFVSEEPEAGALDIDTAPVADDGVGMVFDVEAEEDTTSPGLVSDDHAGDDKVFEVEDEAKLDPFDTPLNATRDALESARAAIMDEPVAEPLSRTTFGLKKNRKGGKSQLQEKLDRKASRDSSTFANALKASALAMLVVGGGGYASLKVAKDQNLNLTFGSEADGAGAAPIAALALEAAPTEAVPSAQIAETEGAAVFTRALSLLEAGDPAALEPMQRAAEMGYVPAQMRLAALYAEGGPLVTADPVMARDWTRRAAEAGEPRAMQHYATQLYDGVGGARDEAGALEWMRKAAEAGRVDAQYNLAHLYENGIKGMRADKVEAFTWYMIAARRGDQQALEAVQRLTPVLSTADRKRARDGADAFNVQPVG